MFVSKVIFQLRFQNQSCCFCITLVVSIIEQALAAVNLLAVLNSK